MQSKPVNGPNKSNSFIPHVATLVTGALDHEEYCSQDDQGRDKGDHSQDGIGEQCDGAASG
jgi:hypothetical protein